MCQWMSSFARRMNLALALLCISMFSLASAHAGTISTVFFEIDVESSLGSASWSIDSNDPDVIYDPVNHRWSWAGSTVPLGNIATLNQANLTVVGDPQIAMGFALTAGAADTTVTISSATLNFNALMNPTGAATAGLTLTQTAGASNAFLTGLAGNSGSAYAAYYNVPPGTVFGEYVSGLSTTTTTSGSGSSGGMVAIPGAVSSMQATFSFVLSAGDQASGTSNFLIVPEPAAIALLACGVLVIRRR